MKKVQLIEWGIIAVALIFGYKFLESIITLLFQLIYAFDSHLLIPDLLKLLLVIAIYAVFFAVLVRNSDKIAGYLTRQDTAAETIAVKIGKRSMLQVILIAICAITILNNIADIIYYIFDAFKNEVRRRSPLDYTDTFLPGKYVFIVKCIQTVVAIIVIYTSKNISDWLIRKNEADELVFDSNSEI